MALLRHHTHSNLWPLLHKSIVSQWCRNMDSGAWKGAAIHSASRFWLKRHAARKLDSRVIHRGHSPGFCAWQPRSPPCCWVSAHPGFPRTVEKKQRENERGRTMPPTTERQEFKDSEAARFYLPILQKRKLEAQRVSSPLK